MMIEEMVKMIQNIPVNGIVQGIFADQKGTYMRILIRQPLRRVHVVVGVLLALNTQPLNNHLKVIYACTRFKKVKFLRVV